MAHFKAFTPRFGSRSFFDILRQLQRCDLYDNDSGQIWRKAGSIIVWNSSWHLSDRRNIQLNAARRSNGSSKIADAVCGLRNLQFLYDWSVCLYVSSWCWYDIGWISTCYVSVYFCRVHGYWIVASAICGIFRTFHVGCIKIICPIV